MILWQKQGSEGGSPPIRSPRAGTLLLFGSAARSSDGTPTAGHQAQTSDPEAKPTRDAADQRQSWGRVLGAPEGDRRFAGRKKFDARAKSVW